MFSEIIDPDMPGYVLANIANKNVSGLFSYVYVETNRISGNKPVLTVSDSITIKVDDVVVINERSYKIAELQPDGDGFIEVILNG